MGDISLQVNGVDKPTNIIKRASPGPKVMVFRMRGFTSHFR